jgi:anti-sigma-K factor RskA
MPHEDLAIPYVLGALSPVERDALSRARPYDRSLEQAIASFEHHVVTHSHPGPGTVPPAELWRNIASALAEEHAALAGKHAENFPDGPWQAIAPGIEAKQIGGQDVWLLRCDPGLILRPRCPAFS